MLGSSQLSLAPSLIFRDVWKATLQVMVRLKVCLLRVCNCTSIQRRTPVAEVKQASVKVRSGFLRTLCSKGTIPILRPFLSGDIDLNELEGPLPTTYIRAAASQGNTEIVLALMNAGVSVNVETSYLEYGEREPPEYRAQWTIF